MFQGATIAERDETIVVEGNHSFPPDSVNRELVRPSDEHTTCPWKGIASYYDVKVDDQCAPAAAWYYAAPKFEAAQIRDHVAFWRGVDVVGS